MHGHPARRTVAHFGDRYQYQYESWKLVDADPLARCSAGLCDRARACSETDPALFAEVIECIVLR